MRTDIDRLSSDLQRLSQEAMDAVELEDIAIKAIRNRMLIRACAGLLNDMEVERRHLIGRVELSLAHPAAEECPRVVQQAPRQFREWTADDYSQFSQLTGRVV